MCRAEDLGLGDAVNGQCCSYVEPKLERSKSRARPVRSLLDVVYTWGQGKRRQRRENLSWREHEFLRRYCSSGPQVLGRGKDALPLLD